MTQDQLQKFFQEKKQKAMPTGTDWAAKRDAWIAAVNHLYRTIEDDYLKAAKAEVEITRRDKDVTENYVGQYQVKELVLRVGDEEVVFSPKGVNIVGALGRIDVQGDRGEATIVWQGEDRWSIVMSRIPTPRLVPLAVDSLAEMLKGIMRP
jgi:hypothetical protein